MINKQVLEELSAQLTSLLPKAEAAGDDAKKLLHSALSSAFERLDIVTREDFEAQRQALHRAQERITQLESTLSAVEEKLENDSEAESKKL